MPAKRHRFYKLPTISPDILKWFLNRDLRNFDVIKLSTPEELDDKLSALNPPPKFHVASFNHQKAIFLVCVEQPNLLLFVDLGCGKSKSVLDVFSYRKLKGECNKLLFLTADHGNTNNILDEVRKHTPHLKAVGLIGSRKERERLLESDADIYVINYMGLQVILSEAGSRKRIITPDSVKEFASRFDFVCYDEAQPLDCKILTPNGWRFMGDVQVNDKIIGIDGGVHQITNILPRGEIDIVEIEFSDGSKTQCSLDHTWEVVDRYATGDKKGKVKLLKTSELKRLTYDNPSSLNAKSFRYYIPWLEEPIHLNSNDEKLPLDPYIVGLIIGDGCISEDVSCVRFASADAEIIDSLRNLLPPEIEIKQEAKYAYSITSRSAGRNKFSYLMDLLKYLKLWWHNCYNKFIPEMYKFASIENRISLLQGLMDTDGWCSKTGNQIQYITTSERLSEDITWLIFSLGGHSSITIAKDKRHPDINYYKIFIKLPDEIIPFRLKRKVDRYKPPQAKQWKRCIENIKYIGKLPAQCITTDAPRGLYITDDFIVTHNCSFLKSTRTITFKICNLLSKFIPYRYGLSGRPIGRQPLDLWPEFYVIDHGDSLGRNAELFKQAFFKPKQTPFAVLWEFKKELKDDLYRVLKNRSIRYAASECLDLPKATSEVIKVQLDTESRVYYRKLIEEILADPSDKWIGSIKNRFVKLRQICSGFLRVDSDDPSKDIIFKCNKDPMIQQLVDLAPDDSKILIFHEFINSGNRIAGLMKDIGVNYRQYAGPNKLLMLEEFKNDPKIKVLIINTHSGAYGLNLQHANISIYTEPILSSIVRAQSEGRTLRSGQTKPVFYYDLITEKSIEEKILGFLKEGNNLFQMLINGVNVKQNIRAILKEELEELRL